MTARVDLEELFESMLDDVWSVDGARRSPAYNLVIAYQKRFEAIATELRDLRARMETAPVVILPPAMGRGWSGRKVRLVVCHDRP